MNKLFTKIAGLTLGLAMAIGVGVALGNGKEAKPVYAAEDVKYSLTPVAGDDNGYASSEDIDVADEVHGKTIKWNVTGNSTMIPWRIGGKNLTNVDRAIYSKTALSEEVNVIKITSGTANCTVNSLAVLVYSTAVDAASGSDNNKLASFSVTTGIIGETVSFEKTNSTSWVGAYYRIVYNLSIGNSNKYIQFTGADFIEDVDDVAIDSITSISLNKNSVPKNYVGEQITATASFAPNNANEEIVWTSSNNEVATIAPSAVYGVANITIVGKGDCTFTAKAKNDQTKTATSETFTVTEAAVKSVYDITFVGNGGTDSTSAITNGDNLISAMVNDGDSISSFGSPANVYAGANKTLKMSSSKNNGSFGIDTGTQTIGKVVLEVKAYSGDTTSLTVKVGALSKVLSVNSEDDALLLTEDFTYFSLDYETASNEISFEATKRLYIRNIILIKSDSTDELKAYPYAADLLRITAAECKSATTPTTWGTLSEAWDALGGDAQDLFNDSQANENGNVIEQSLARYETIVKKYQSQLGENANFMSRTIPNNSINTIFGTEEGISATAIIVIVSLVSLTAIAGFVILRKRKEQ